MPTKKRKIDNDDKEYFAPITEVEKSITSKNDGNENYICNLKTENGFTVLPHGYLVLRDCDEFNHLKKENEEHYIYLKMLRKTIQGKKKIVPICLKCNDKATTDTIIGGTSNILNDNVIKNVLVNCKHAAVSLALYTYENVIKVESDGKMCVVLKDSKKLHIAASYDGESFATVVCRIGRNSKKGKCCFCKGEECGHQYEWNKNIRHSVLDEIKEDEVDADEEEIEEEEMDVNEKLENTKNNINKPKLKFPPTEATHKMFKLYETHIYNEKTYFVDEYNEGQKCFNHGNDWSSEDPIGKG